MTNRLTEKQEKFAQLIATGKGLTEAYRAAYPKSKGNDATISKEASRLAVNPHVSPRIAELKRQNENTAIWTREGTLKRLLNIADEAQENLMEPIVNKDGEIVGNKYNAAAAQVAIKCAEVAAKMCGHNEPDKTEVEIKPFKVEIEVIKA